MDQLATIVSRALSETCETTENDLSKAQYIRAAELLLGSSRTGEANDPEAYISAVVRILSAYPIDVVQQVIDPLNGLPGKLEWLPKPFEIRKACEEIYRPIRRRREWEERSKEQLAERERLANLPPPKQTYEAFKADMAARGMPIDKQSRNIESAAKLKAKYGLTNAQWDAIPDLPANHSDYWEGVGWK
jgi:hypothetical protein